MGHGGRGGLEEGALGHQRVLGAVCLLLTRARMKAGSSLNYPLFF